MWQTALPSDPVLPPPGSSPPPTLAQREAPRPQVRGASSADQLRSSSPSLPDLPSLQSIGSAPTTPSSSFRHQRTDSSVYYTASWGSPYDKPLPASGSLNQIIHEDVNSSEIGDDSPLRTFGLQPPPLFKSKTLDGSRIEASLLASKWADPDEQPHIAAKGNPEDWVRSYLQGGSPRKERDNWLSDGDSGEANSDYGLSGPAVDDAEAWFEEDEYGETPKTPTLRSYLKKKEDSKSLAKSFRRHKGRKSNETLKQRDFWDILHDPQVSSDVDKMESSKYADPPWLEPEDKKTATARLEEKPLPTPPNLTRTSTDSPMEKQAPGVVPPNLQRSVSSAQVLGQHPKKKIMWKGKNVVVAIPYDNRRGTEGAGLKPLTKKQTQEVYRSWQELGYDVRGFAHGEDEDPNGLNTTRQSRELSPEELADRWRPGQSDLRVSIPNKADWDAYVNFLQEEKLRALGVALGDEEAPIMSPAVSSMGMSRMASNDGSQHQYPALPFSPPLPTSSVASNHMQNPFSPAFGMPGTSTTPSSHVGSIASPPPQAFGHMNRPSMSLSPPLPGVWSPQQQQLMQQQGMARGGSPGGMGMPNMMQPFPQMFNQDPRAQSPSMAQSPGGEMMAQLKRQEQMLQQQLQQQQIQQRQQEQLSARQTPRLEEVEEAEEEDEETVLFDMDKSLAASNKQTEIKTPVPLGHRKNVSASLQKEIDEAENHLQEQDENQLEDKENLEKTVPSKAQVNTTDSLSDVPLTPLTSKSEKKVSLALSGLAASKYADSDIDEDETLHHPQPHSRGHSLSMKTFHEQDADEDLLREAVTVGRGAEDDFSEAEHTNPSEVDTNPSAPATPAQLFSSGTHERGLSDSSNPWVDTRADENSSPVVPSFHGRSKHGSKTSISSKLNVDAEEFKFDPDNSSFKPSNFSFNSFETNAFSPESSSHATQSAKDSNGFNGFGAPSTTRLNVAAPAFRPNGYALPQSTSAQPPSSFPTGEFSFGSSLPNFTSSTPKFRPDAPEFTPGNSIYTGTDVGSGQSGSEVTPSSAKGRKSIFNLDQIISSDIVKPTKKSKAVPIVAPTSDKDDEQEDESGRLKQPEGRQKRARQGGDDGDSVPQFAMPTIPIEENSPFKPTEPISPVSDQETRKVSNVAELRTPEISDEEADVVSDKLDIKTKGMPVRRSILEDSPDYEGKSWEPYSFRDNQESTEFANAFPDAPSKVAGKLDALPSPPKYKIFDPRDDSEDDMNELSVQQAELASSGTLERGQNGASKHQKKSSLSAAAKPFEFNTGAKPIESLSAVAKPFEFNPSAKPVEFNPTSAIFNSSGPTPDPPKLGGLAASRYATTPPPPLPPKVTERSDPAKFADVPWPEEVPVDYSTINEPSFEELDAVMRQLGEDQDFGVERTSDFHDETVLPSVSPWKQQSPDRRAIPDFDETPAHRLYPNSQLRSDAPSPSPRRYDQQYKALPGQKLHEAVLTPKEDDSLSIAKLGGQYESPIHRLNTPGNANNSDWELESGEEQKLQSRAKFFDNKVNDVVGGLIQERLQPLEKTLAAIQESLTHISANGTSRHARGGIQSGRQSGKDSDADDEDDEDTRGFHARSKSPRKDKMDKIRAVMMEVLAAHKPPRATEVARELAPSAPVDLSEIQKALKEVQFSIDQQDREEYHIHDVKAVVEEALARQLPTETSKDGKQVVSAANAEVLELRIKALESQLKGTNDRVAEEQKLRREAEEKTHVAERDLKLSQETEAYFKKTAEEAEKKLKSGDDKRQQTLVQTQMRTALLEGAQENLQHSTTKLQNQNAALEGKLREAQFSADKYKKEAEGAESEIKSLKHSVETFKLQMEESIRVREGMRGKFDNLQEDMAKAAHEIGKEQAAFVKRENELNAKNELLNVKLEAEIKMRERFQVEVERLEDVEMAAIRAKVEHEQIASSNSKLENLLESMRVEVIEAQKKAATHEAQIQQARDSAHDEVTRTRHSLAADIEAANNAVNLVRAELEAQLDRVKMDHDTSKERHALQLEEAADAKRDAIQEQQRLHQQKIEDLTSSHDRALGHAVEDKDRSENHLQERLALSDDKVNHLQERVEHLNEKLEIAQSAANAAAQAARSARSPTTVKEISPVRTATIKTVTESATRGGSMSTEKISPQALRESILVLQEQLQEREGRIEGLESKLSDVDLEAPKKISDRDTEISWLRELLAVRIADLEDVINTMSQDEVDHDAVKDAAIRLRANLQMEQQERERAMHGGQWKAPSFQSIQDSFASPRSSAKAAVLPLAAAWGNWRKGGLNLSREGGFGSLSQLASGGGEQETPSKPSPAGSAQSFLSGLLTPPSTNARRSPTPQELDIARAQGLDITSTRRGGASARAREKMPSRNPSGSLVGKGPQTPPLMRKASYDQDAKSSIAGFAGFDDDDSDSSRVQQQTISSPTDGLFGGGLQK
jgi:hypothetical protein